MLSCRAGRRLEWWAPRGAKIPRRQDGENRLAAGASRRPGDGAAPAPFHAIRGRGGRRAMKKYLVVMSQMPGHGRGVSGRTLLGFLRTYAGHRAVAACSAADLLDGSAPAAETVFLGLPSPVTDRHLARLRSRRLVLFDLHDHHYPLWSAENEPVLRRASPLYLKCWNDERWDFGIGMGLAPIRRYGKLRLALELGRLRRALGLAEPRHRYDVLFLGAATGGETRGQGQAEVPNQRVKWLLELRDAGHGLHHWGGLLERTISPELRARHGDLSGFTIRGKVPFRRYFHALRTSRVALTPEGNAPWSYRHYEAIYARSLIVTSDFRPIRTLIPLPNDGMIHVGPHEPVLPAIERALRLREERPELLEENVRFLERWLDRGMYSRRRPDLWERFVAQL